MVNYLACGVGVAVVAGYLAAAVEVGQRDGGQDGVIDAGLSRDGHVRRVLGVVGAASDDGRRRRRHGDVIVTDLGGVPVQLTAGPGRLTRPAAAPHDTYANISLASIISFVSYGAHFFAILPR